MNRIMILLRPKKSLRCTENISQYIFQILLNHQNQPI